MAGNTGLDWSNFGNWSLSNPTMNIPTLPSLGVGDFRATTPWDTFGNWMNDSGILGKTMSDGTKVQGWGGLGLGAAQGLFDGWLGLQKLGLARDQLDQSKRAFNMNFDAQAKTTNARLEDQQRARVASNPTAYQSVGDYMAKYKIGG